MDKVVEIRRKGGVATVRLLSGEMLRVPSALYLERRLHVNQPLDAGSYRAYMAERGYPHALEAAMKFLALRDRSVQEIRARLRRSCYDEAVIDRVLAALDRHGLVSDARFAAQWVDSRAKKYGRSRISQELYRKGVAGQEAKDALDGLSEEEEYQAAVDQARKMRRKFRDDPVKIAQSLSRRGYRWALARRAAEEALRTK